MKIRRQTPEDAKAERMIVIALITSENVCRSLRETYSQEFFQGKVSKEISKWCINYFDKYDTNVGKEIQAQFELASKAGKIDPDFEEEIQHFLTGLSQEYEEWEDFNEQYYIDLGNSYFKKRNYVLLADKLQGAAKDGDVDECDSVYSNFIKVQEDLDTARKITSVEGIESFQASLENKPPILFELPGALGDMIGPIERSSFIGLLGREKVGKTWGLMMFAWLAAKQGLNVLMIEVGDMMQDQLDTRFASCFTNKVARQNDVGWVYKPVLDCLKNQDGSCEMIDGGDILKDIYDKDNNWKGKKFSEESLKNIDKHEPCIECWKDRMIRYKHFKGSIWWKREQTEMWSFREVKQAVKKFSKKFKGSITTEAFPMASMKASDIRNLLIRKHKQEGKLYDITLIDYPDILNPENPSEQYRHRENAKWMVLRQISQEFHNCVIAPTQADADSYDRETLTLKNYSEDKRKYSYVTHFYSINKTQAEEMAGVFRLAPLIIRESSLKVGNAVTVLQDLSRSRVYLGSFHGKIPLISKRENF